MKKKSLGSFVLKGLGQKQGRRHQGRQKKPKSSPRKPGGRLPSRSARAAQSFRFPSFRAASPRVNDLEPPEKPPVDQARLKAEAQTKTIALALKQAQAQAEKQARALALSEAKAESQAQALAQAWARLEAQAEAHVQSELLAQTQKLAESQAKARALEQSLAPPPLVRAFLPSPSPPPDSLRLLTRMPRAPDVEIAPVRADPEPPAILRPEPARLTGPLLLTTELLRPGDRLRESIEGFLLDQRSEHTRRAYGRDLKRFVQYLLERKLDRGIENLDRSVLIAYKDRLLSEGLEHTTIDRHLATLRSGTPRLQPWFDGAKAEALDSRR